MYILAYSGELPPTNKSSNPSALISPTANDGPYCDSLCGINRWILKSIKSASEEIKFIPDFFVISVNQLFVATRGAE